MNCRSPRLWSVVLPTVLTTLLATSPLTLGSSPRANAATLPISSATAEVHGAIPLLVAKSIPGPLLDPSTQVTFSFILPFRNQAGLDKAVAGMYDPKSPSFGQYLTHAQFQAQYGASAADFAAVKAYALSQGFTIESALPSNKVLIVSAPAARVESAFGMSLSNFTAPDGRAFFAPLSAPKLPADIAAKIDGIGGLSNAAVMHPHMDKREASQMAAAIAESKAGIDLTYAAEKPKSASFGLASYLSTPEDSSNSVGTGAVNGGLTPTDIYQAYNFKPYTLGSVPATTPSGFGKGQTLGLYELDVEIPTDITTYETMFNLPLAFPVNIETTTTTGLPPAIPLGGDDEVDLDIELQIALAPLATGIDVYETSNASVSGVPYSVTLYQVIADNDAESEISTSWGTSEINQTQSDLNGEEKSFEQMAAQGQSIFAASGDSGAFDDSANSENSLQVDDPASDPYMTATGGTTLNVTTPGVAPLVYASESSWGTPASGSGATATAASGGGGGVSRIWTIASSKTQPGAPYQVGVVPNAGAIPSGYPTADTDSAYPTNPDPSKYRNLPDLSINANPDTGYDVAVNGVEGEAVLIGGTSCAAPLWAGITARINEQRALNGLGTIGFFNPMLYRIGVDDFSGLFKGIQFQYPTTMHDVQDGTTNLYFPAVKGFDNSTGWGSPNGVNVIAEYGSPTPTHLYVNPGNKDNYVFFDIMPKATSYIIKQSLSSSLSSPTTFTTTTSPYISKGLTDKTKYYYSVQAVYSGGTSNIDGPYLSIPQVVAFKTTPNASVTTSGTSLTFKWTTTSESDSKVLLGTSKTALTQSVYVPTYELNHTVTLKNETEGTLYYYEVISNDGTNTATSPIYQVTLPKS